jgi:hypothetical protein
MDDNDVHYTTVQGLKKLFFKVVVEILLDGQFQI